MTQYPASRTVVVNPHQGGGTFGRFARLGSRPIGRSATCCGVVDFGERASALERSVFSRGEWKRCRPARSSEGAPVYRGALSNRAPVLACLA